MNDLVNSLPAHVMKTGNLTKFAPKLDEAKRRAIYALDKSNVHRNVIAAAFGVDRRTVSHICNEHSVHYKSVRLDYKRMGHSDFVAKYLTPEVVSLVSKVNIAAPTKEDDTGPKPKAVKKKGMHTVHPEQCAYSHRIEITYQHSLDPVGWYYRDLDGEDPDEWLHNGSDSLMTSQAALTFAEANLVDK